MPLPQPAVLLAFAFYVVSVGMFCPVFSYVWGALILLFFLLQLSIMAMQRPHSTASRSQMALQSQPRPGVTSAGIPTPMSHTLSSPHTCYKGANAVTITNG